MTIIAIILMLLTIIICALMLHARLKTVYTIGDGKLVATVGIHKRRIDITTIQKIKYPAKHDLVGNRPALGMQGMYIYVISGFNLFVSPEHPQQFIEDLHKVNPGIQIVDT